MQRRSFRNHRTDRNGAFPMAAQSCMRRFTKRRTHQQSNKQTNKQSLLAAAASPIDPIRSDAKRSLRVHSWPIASSASVRTDLTVSASGIASEHQSSQRRSEVLYSLSAYLTKNRRARPDADAPWPLGSRWYE